MVGGPHGAVGCGLVGHGAAPRRLPEAAPGQGEEHVVERGPADLGGRHATPARSRARSSPGDQRRPALHPGGDDGAGGLAMRRRTRRSTADATTGASADLDGGDHDVVAGQVGLEPLGRVVGDHDPVVDDHHPVRHGVGLVEVVRRQHDRRAVVGPQPLDLRLEVGPVLGIEARGRLVEEQEPRAVDHAEGHVEAPPLPPGQAADRAVAEPPEVERGEQGLAAGRPPRGARGRSSGPGPPARPDTAGCGRRCCPGRCSRCGDGRPPDPRSRPDPRPGPSPRSAAAASSACAAWSTCRRRWGRGRRPSRPSPRRGRGHARPRRSRCRPGRCGSGLVLRSSLAPLGHDSTSVT